MQKQALDTPILVDQMLSRFTVLYPKIKKKNLKEKLACQAYSKEDLANKIEIKKKEIQEASSFYEEVKLISKLAKTEIRSCQNFQSEQFGQNYLHFLQTEIEQIHLPQQMILQPNQIFTLFLIAHSSNSSKDYLLNIFQLLYTYSNNYIKHYLTNNQSEQTSEEFQLAGVSFLDQLHSDSVLLQQLAILKHLTKYIFKKTKDHEIIEILLQSVVQSLQKTIRDYKNGLGDDEQQSVMTMNQLAPLAFSFKYIITCVLPHFQQNSKPMNELEQIFGLGFEILIQCKQISRLYLKKNEITWKKVGTGAKVIKRAQGIFTEIQRSLIEFSCAYFTIFGGNEHVLSLFELIFVDEGKDENYLLLERLQIMKDLNFLFQNVSQIFSNKQFYWSFIMRGIYDYDAITRKLAVSILQSNIQFYSQKQLNQKEKIDFENLWGPFFEVYDTLDSYSSHLTKAIWQRTESIYKYLQGEEQKNLHPLQDFKEWLECLTIRALTHENHNIRKYIQKEILQRQFTTKAMREFTLSRLPCYFNEGIILKDANTFTQFSKNNELIIDFYQRYLQELGPGDHLELLFDCLVEHVDHHQLIVSIFRILAQGSTQANQFVKAEQLKKLIDFLNRFKQDLIFSNRYLCYRYTLEIMVNCLNSQEIFDDQTNLIQFYFLSFLGQMPFEFFSEASCIIYKDTQGLKSAVNLVKNKLGIDHTRNIIQSCLQDLFQVKAPLKALQKFGNNLSQHKLVIQGIVKLILALELCETNSKWFDQWMQQNLLVFTSQILSSSYLSAHIINEKVSCFILLYQQLLKYSEGGQLNDVVLKHIKMCTSPLLDRMLNIIVYPITQLPNQKTREQITDNQAQDLVSSLSFFQDYLVGLRLAIQAFHTSNLTTTNTPNQCPSPELVEKVVKQLLQQVLTLPQTSSELSASLSLTRYILLAIGSTICQAYQDGIQENISQGKKVDLLIPESIFVIGKTICLKIAESCQIDRVPRDEQPENDLIQQCLLEANITVRNAQVSSLYLSWQLMASLLFIFKFDSNLNEEIQIVLLPQISALSQRHIIENMEVASANVSGGCRAKGSNWTKEEGQFNQVLYQILSLAYLPLFSESMTRHLIQFNQDNSLDIEIETTRTSMMSQLDEYQRIVQKCWDIIKSTRGVFEPIAFLRFLDFAFSEQILEILEAIKAYDSVSRKQSISLKFIDFYQELVKDILDVGNQFWLILRSTFNHFMMLFIKKPQLISVGFEKMLVQFNVCREIRSLDAEINVYRMEQLFPQVIPKSYEDLPFEQISYQGAYIRTLSLIAIEGIITSILTQINSKAALIESFQDQKLQITLNALENAILEMIQINQKLSKNSQSEMPYCQQHREKLRIWQALLVYLQLLDPTIYNQEFRKLRKQISGVDIIQSINDFVWANLSKGISQQMRQYIEAFTIRFSLAFPQDTLGGQQFTKILLNVNAKPLASASFILVAGYCMVFTETGNDSQTTTFKKKVFESMVGFTTSNTAHTRLLAQYFVKKMYSDNLFRPFIPSGLDLIVRFFDECKNSEKLLVKYEEEIQQFHKLISCQSAKTILAQKIDSYGEYNLSSFTERLKNITAEMITGLREKQSLIYDHKRDFWLLDLKEREERGELSISMPLISEGTPSNVPSEAQINNYQKKVLAWEQFEQEHESILQKSRETFQEVRKRNEVIVCATLIDKIPNLAGLTRTCEIMNAKALLISNGDVVKSEEFKQIAVTAQKWQPIYEVKEDNLVQYLQYQKQVNGYSIVGLEQTADSQSLTTFQFPVKSILLLGKEKEGIPQEYIGLLDFCVEIPQYGLIRSLNVHVSGALCLWEYTKQINQK